jgi:hypothetical protein
MSWMRLLAAGRSLMGGAEQINRYRLPRTKALPTFGGNANPFASTVHPGGALAPGHPETAPAAAATIPEAPSAAPARGGWLARLNPFSTADGNRATSTPAGSRESGQPELSLQNVKVVRNDLSEGGETAAVGRGKLRGRPVRHISCEAEPLLELDELPREPAEIAAGDRPQPKLF